MVVRNIFRTKRKTKYCNFVILNVVIETATLWKKKYQSIYIENHLELETFHTSWTPLTGQDGIMHWS